MSFLLYLIKLFLEHPRFTVVELHHHLQDVRFLDLQVRPLTPGILVGLHLRVRTLDSHPLEVMLPPNKDVVDELLGVPIKELLDIFWH